jgi:hypothetical protein
MASLYDSDYGDADTPPVVPLDPTEPKTPDPSGSYPTSDFSLGMDTALRPSPFYLIPPSDLRFDDLKTSFGENVSGYYTNESALMVAFSGKDSIADFLPSMTSIDWGAIFAGGLGVLGFGIGLAVGGPPAGVELMITGVEEGFEIGFEVHDTYEDIVNRGSALLSLYENWDSPTPGETPSPTPETSFVDESEQVSKPPSLSVPSPEPQMRTQDEGGV